MVYKPTNKLGGPSYIDCENYPLWINKKQAVKLVVAAMIWEFQEDGKAVTWLRSVYGHIIIDPFDYGNIISWFIYPSIDNS
jgi:hypothetical protein